MPARLPIASRAVGPCPGPDPTRSAPSLPQESLLLAHNAATSACLQVQPTAVGARNYSQCDSMLIGDRAGANTYPYIQVGSPCAAARQLLGGARSVLCGCTL